MTWTGHGSFLSSKFQMFKCDCSEEDFSRVLYTVSLITLLTVAEASCGVFPGEYSSSQGQGKEDGKESREESLVEENKVLDK